jgi:alpha-1,2-mannosyltransferase
MKKTNLIENKKTHTWIICLFLVFIFCTIYYYLTWGDLQTFAEKVDPCETLFCDFTIHYYPTARSIFEIKEPIYGYLYSPFFAILTSPLGRLPLDTAAQLWGLIQIVLTLLLFVAPLSMLKLDTLKTQLLYTAIFFTSLPVLHNFKWGQVSSLMTITIIAAFLAHKSGRSIWAGILLGFSTSIKYYPAFFILYFLFKKDKAAMVAFTLTCFFLLFLLPVSLLGFDHWLNFMNLSLQKISVLAGDAGSNPNTQFFPHIMMRIFHLDPARILVASILRFSGIMIAFFNVFLLWKINKLQVARDEILSAALLFCTLPFLIETSWHHYFIFLPFLQISLLLHERNKWMKTFVVCSIILSSIFILNLFPGWEDYTKWGFSFLSSSLILLTAYLLSFESIMNKRKLNEN